MTERALAYPVPRGRDHAIHPRCPVCQARLAGVVSRPTEPDSELRVRCSCGFEMTFDGPGLIFDRREPRAQ